MLHDDTEHARLHEVPFLAVALADADEVITEEDAGDPVDLEQCLRQRRPRGLLLGLELGGTTRHNLPDRQEFERRRVRRLLRLNEHDNPPATSGIAAHRSRHPPPDSRSEEHTSELKSLMRIPYAVFCLN